MTPRRNNFRYLNREGRWLDFHTSGVEVGADGAVRLCACPRALDPAPASSTPAECPVTAGLAVDRSGRVYYSDPGAGELWFEDACAVDWCRLRSAPDGIAHIARPCGLAVLERSGRLLVVDEQGRRLVFLDLGSGELREVWDGRHPALGPRFVAPTAVAVDGAEDVYVLDRGARRVVKVRRSGERVTSFEEALVESELVGDPCAVTVAERPEGPLVFVADAAWNHVAIFDAAGKPWADASGDPVVLTLDDMGEVQALAASADTLFIADGAGRRLLTFGIGGKFPFTGDAVGFTDVAVALAVDTAGTLWALPAAGGPPLRFSTEGAFVRTGVLWSGPIAGGQLPVRWDRARASLVTAPNAHVEFFFAVGNGSEPPPVDLAAESPFRDSRWRVLPADVSDFLFDTASPPDPERNTGLNLFVGVRFSSDRSASVALSQIRAEFDRDGYEHYLPKIYREPLGDGGYVRRYLALFESLFEEIEDETDDLARYLDPASAPASALPWLAGWLAAGVEEGDPEALLRQLVAGAFERQRWRGTVWGLKLALLEEAGVHATISEPIQCGIPWGFPGPAGCAATSPVEPPALGFGTSLPAVEAGGAVLGMNAVLDRSYLVTDAQYGEPPFDELAHQFVVEVPRGEANDPERLARVRAVIESEKPAHTTYRLEIIDPGLRVGRQARVGIDCVLGGSLAPTALGERGSAGGLRLAGGEPVRVGKLRLGEKVTL